MLGIFLAKTLKQTKAGPRSSGTTFLVSIGEIFRSFKAEHCQLYVN